MANKALLLYHIKKNGDTQKVLAQSLGITAQALALKIKRDTFRSGEITQIAERYYLSPEETVAVFLTRG